MLVPVQPSVVDFEVRTTTVRPKHVLSHKRNYEILVIKPPYRKWLVDNINGRVKCGEGSYYAGYIYHEHRNYDFMFLFFSDEEDATLFKLAHPDQVQWDVINSHSYRIKKKSKWR